jgi:predicted GNAT superfamily acetyltransferase
MYEPLLTRLADAFHLVAPDYPGFGHSDAPAPAAFDYPFDNLARVIERFTELIHLDRFLSFDATRQRHLGTSPNVTLYDPDLWTDEYAFLSRPGQSDIQMDLFYDYQTNVASTQHGRIGFVTTSRRSSCCGAATTRRFRSKRPRRTGGTCQR